MSYFYLYEVPRLTDYYYINAIFSTTIGIVRHCFDEVLYVKKSPVGTDYGITLEIQGGKKLETYIREYVLRILILQSKINLVKGQ